MKEKALSALEEEIRKIAEVGEYVSIEIPQGKSTAWITAYKQIGRTEAVQTNHFAKNKNEMHKKLKKVRRELEEGKCASGNEESSWLSFPKYNFDVEIIKAGKEKSGKPKKADITEKKR